MWAKVKKVLEGIFEGIFSSKSIIEGISEGLFYWRNMMKGFLKGFIYWRYTYNEGIVECRRDTGMNCIMSQDVGQTTTQLPDQKVDVAAFHSKDWLKHNLMLILESFQERNKMHTSRLFFLLKICFRFRRDFQTTKFSTIRRK